MVEESVRNLLIDGKRINNNTIEYLIKSNEDSK